MASLAFGVIFLLAAIASAFGNVDITPKMNFAMSLCVFFIGISALLDDPLKRLQRKMSFTRIIQYIPYFLSAACTLIVLVSHISLVDDIMKTLNDNFFLLAGMGLSLIGLFFSEWNSKQIEQQLKIVKKKAETQAKREIISKIKKTTHDPQ